MMSHSPIAAIRVLVCFLFFCVTSTVQLLKLRMWMTRIAWYGSPGFGSAVTLASTLISVQSLLNSSDTSDLPNDPVLKMLAKCYAAALLQCGCSCTRLFGCTCGQVYLLLVASGDNSLFDLIVTSSADSLCFAFV